MTGKKLTQPDRVTYSESVKINIGDYESRDVFLSYATDVAEGETVQDAVVRSKNIVIASIKKTESIIRKKSAKFVDFQTKKKLETR